MSADADKICNEVDLRQLESLLQNITYAKVDRDDIERFGDDNFIKLFRLSQMSIEYLIYTQNYLECLTKTLDLQYKNAYESTHDIQDQIKVAISGVDAGGDRLIGSIEAFGNRMVGVAIQHMEAQWRQMHDAQRHQNSRRGLQIKI